MSDATNNRFYRQTSPSESTEPVREVLRRYSHTQQAIGRGDNAKIEFSDAEAEEKLTLLLDQEYSKGVSDALAALPENLRLDAFAADSELNSSAPFDKTWNGGWNDALKEARNNIEKLKEPSNE